MPVMTSEAENQKSRIRAGMRAMLTGMTPEDRRTASTAACARLVAIEAFRAAGTVMLYLPLQTEVDTTAIAIACFQAGKSVCVPSVDWDRKDMRAVEIRTFDDHVLQIDAHGLRTPREGLVVLPDLIDLIVVPGVAFDPSGVRLGRGGGFYDRFLKRLRRDAQTIGLAFDLQVIDEIPCEAHDVRVGMVVTNRRVTVDPSTRSRT